MVKGYSDQERQQIRQTILDAGRTFWQEHGYKEVTVRNLAKAANIAVGTFYLFFPNKEALFFALLEAEEQQLKQQLLTGDWLQPPLTRASFAAMLKYAFQLAAENTIIRQAVELDVYQQMTAALSAEAIDQHAEQDLLDLGSILQWARAQDCLEPVDEAVVSGALRALFLLLLHEDVIGRDIFASVVEFWIEALTKTIIREER